MIRFGTFLLESGRRIVETVRANRLLLLSSLPVTAVLGFGLFPASTASYQVHDFLDYFPTVAKLFADREDFWGYQGSLPLLLNGQIPIGAAGASVLSPQYFLFGFFEPAVATALGEFLGRLGIYLSSTFLLLRMAEKYNISPWFGVVSGSYATLMPFWPSTSWSILAVWLQILAVWLNLQRPGRIQPMLLAILAAQINFFAFGGVALILVSLVSFVMVWKDKSKILGQVPLVLATGLSSLFAIGPVVSTTFFSSFVSHRVSWESAQPSLSIAESFAHFSAEFVDVLVNGQYHFGTNNLILGQWPSIALVVGIMALSVATISRVTRPPGLGTSLFSPRDRVFFLSILSLLLVSTVYALEVSKVTNLSKVFGVPFQFNRAIALAPHIWTFIFFFGLSILSSFLCNRIRSRAAKTVGGITFLVILVAQMVSGWIPAQARIAEILSIPHSGQEFQKFFQEDDYADIMSELSKEGLVSPTTVSYGLDPMKAAFSGFPTIDGYFYNYPLEYKLGFREIIQKDASLPGGRLEYFDSFGSRLYLFERADSDAKDLAFDWCAAQDLGAQLVLAEEDLGSQGRLQLLVMGERFRAYKIVSCD